jgi:hypothetical protein
MILQAPLDPDHPSIPIWSFPASSATASHEFTSNLELRITRLKAARLIIFALASDGDNVDNQFSGSLIDNWILRIQETAESSYLPLFVVDFLNEFDQLYHVPDTEHLAKRDRYGEMFEHILQFPLSRIVMASQLRHFYRSVSQKIGSMTVRLPRWRMVFPPTSQFRESGERDTGQPKRNENVPRGLLVHEIADLEICELRKDSPPCSMIKLKRSHHDSNTI